MKQVTTFMDLAPREQEILKLLVEGKEDKQIASTLGIGVHTVNDALRRMREKVGCSNRVTLAVWYVRQEPRKK